jgi:hypothetical protein
LANQKVWGDGDSDMSALRINRLAYSRIWQYWHVNGGPEWGAVICGGRKGRPVMQVTWGKKRLDKSSAAIGSDWKMATRVEIEKAGREAAARARRRRGREVNIGGKRATWARKWWAEKAKGTSGEE